MRALLLAGLILFSGAGMAEDEPQSQNQQRQRPAKRRKGPLIEDPYKKELKLQADLEEKINNKGLSDKERVNAAAQLSNLRQQVMAQVDKHPTSWAHQAGGAGFFLQGGNYDKAAECADRALEAGSPDGDPKLTAQVLVKRGAAKWYKGDVVGAWQDGLSALEMDPTSQEAIELVKYTEGRANRGQEGVAGMRDEAADKERMKNLLDPTRPHTAKEWQEREDKNPTEVGRLLSQAITARRRGDLAGMKNYAEAAIEADPADAMPRAFLGAWQAVTEGQQNDAVINLTRAAAAGWKDTGIFGQRAKALLAAGGKERARAALNDLDLLVKLEPNNARHWNGHALAQLMLVREPTGLDGVPSSKIAPILASLKHAATLDPRSYGETYDKMLTLHATLTRREQQAHAAAEKERARKREEAEYARLRQERDHTPKGKLHNVVEDLVGQRVPDSAFERYFGYAWKTLAVIAAAGGLARFYMNRIK